MKSKKKLILLSTFVGFALLLSVFFLFLFQSISMINILYKSPGIIANNNDRPGNKLTENQLDPGAGGNENQIFSAEEENPKDTPALDGQKENYREKNNYKIASKLDPKLEPANNNPDPLENYLGLQENKAMLMDQLEELLANRDYSDQLVNTVNQLAWIGDSDALAALVDSYQKTKYDGDLSSKILNAISKIKNPEVVYDLGDYMNDAIDDEDDTLLMPVATALSNIGSEEATDMLIQALSTTPGSDNADSIVSKAIANIRNTGVAPILVNMIEKKVNGYEGAMAALLKLGDFGTEKIAKLLTQDENIEYREKLLSVTETMPFDEETYYTINKLAELNEDFEDVFRKAGNNLAKKDGNGDYGFKE